MLVRLKKNIKSDPIGKQGGSKNRSTSCSFARNKLFLRKGKQLRQKRKIYYTFKSNETMKSEATQANDFSPFYIWKHYRSIL